MKITKTWARKMLKAVNETIKLYKYGSTDNGGCSFCTTAHDMTPHDRNKCAVCPWLVFMGQRCTGHSKEGLTSFWEERPTYNRYDDIPISKRLPRLYGWRKRLTNIIERGK